MLIITVHLLGPFRCAAARIQPADHRRAAHRRLDKAGIKHALVLSEAFWIGGPGGGKVQRLGAGEGQATAVQLENDWTAKQVARYPDRLLMACGINPLDAWAIAELERCSRIPVVHAMKLNVGEGGDKHRSARPAQVSRLRDFFAAANARRMPIVIHLGSRGGFGRPEVRTFLHEIISAAPDIPVQIAHSEQRLPEPDALSEFADARARHDPPRAKPVFRSLRRLVQDIDPHVGQFIADAIRKLGLEHVLYASGRAAGRPARAGRTSTGRRSGELPLDLAGSSGRDRATTVRAGTCGEASTAFGAHADQRALGLALP
jgi:predicted TIM-barrel fold metal-dependent hydrolase